MVKKEIVFASIFVLVLILAALFYLGFNDKEQIVNINSFEECVQAGNSIMESYPRRCIHEGEVFIEELDFDRVSLIDYFSTKMFEKGIELNEGRIPIEGFTPSMYLDLFSKLEEKDFRNVRAINGIYNHNEGELIFMMNSSEFITSADGSLNEEGMGDLLGNLEQRLDVSISDNDSVDELIELII